MSILRNGCVAASDLGVKGHIGLIVHSRLCMVESDKYNTKDRFVVCS